MSYQRELWRTRSAINKQSLQSPHSSAWFNLTAFPPPFQPQYLNDWSEERLVPYEGTRYKRLYWERKDAHKFSSTPFRFLALPPEIRNQIYDLVLDHGVIELAPLYATRTETNGRQRIHHMKKYKHEIVPGLKVLRVCKKINEEATPDLLCNVYGFDIFAHFVRTIGKRNLALVRKITECYPKPPSRSGIRSDGTTGRSMTGLWNFEMAMRKMGLKVNTHRNGNGMKECTRERTMALVELVGGLKEYRIVMAEEHSVDEDFEVESAGGLLGHMSAAKLAGVRCQVVLLRTQHESPRWLDQRHEEQVAQVADILEDHGFGLVYAMYDELGRYQVPEANWWDLEDQAQASDS
ncbi:hypothetical protein LTR17_001364 [Elasticomyces elasticus]|nr:hypothetical protein LTR17_001364 [Elasticomyces elasticus]